MEFESHLHLMGEPKPMKLLITLTLCVACSTIFAQERTITGRLTANEGGMPLPGINITIKGTTVGTTTDADGYYSIKVPIGSTLVFSFVGMATREVLVTEDNLQPVRRDARRNPQKAGTKQKTREVFPNSLYQDSLLNDEPGIATLTNKSPTYRNSIAIEPSVVTKIRKIGSHYVVKTDSDPIKRNGFSLQFSTTLGVETINRLPKFQNTYSQGRPVGNNYQWLGADQQEIFSWGPQITTLVYDGSNYPYDKNGRMIPIGSGSGKEARMFDARAFFRPAISNTNELFITLPGPKHSTILFDVENRQRTGIIPNSQFKKHSFTLSAKNFEISNSIRSNASFSYNRSTGKLMSRGANLASIIGSVYRTPATFDNTNGLSPKSARNNTESYKLKDGGVRSHAPELVDNPYGLINELPDNEQSERIVAFINLDQSTTGRFTTVLNANVDHQRSQNIFGASPGYVAFPKGRLTERNESRSLINAVLTPSYRFAFYDSDLKVSLSLQSQYIERSTKRSDGFNFSNETYGEIGRADSVNTINRNLSRTTQEIILNAKYEYFNLLNVNFSNRSYFSSTLNRISNYLLPSGSISLNVAQLFNIWDIDYLKIYSTASRSIREAPLLYSNWSHASSNISVESYTTFFESGEIFFNSNLSPETETKFETGLKFSGRSLYADIAYYNDKTRDFIVPALNRSQFELRNLATIQNKGATVSIGYFRHVPYGSWETNLRWTKYNNEVLELQSSDESIALAGFQSVQTALVKGKPVGAIYGTTYLRNAAGEKIIGDDGFPVKENRLQLIGNPIPDFSLGWSTFFNWKKFKISFVFDYKHGGDMWNGTNAILDYLGRSANTGSERNITNYIFDGVDFKGIRNTQPVDFSVPSMTVQENRWVRYGWDGVAEEYIEKATALRLSELVLSYTHPSPRSKIKEVKFSLIGRNLFLITPYSGADPSSSLFGYSTGAGLDLFNTPSTRSYGAQIRIKI